MSSFARGAAFVDGSGAVLAADEGFLAQLGASREGATAALRARAAESPELRALLDSDGPAVAILPGRGGEPVPVEKLPAPGGALLLARAERCQEWLEQAMRSQGLTRLAAGLAHDIKNPLNAMALQLALLGEKLSSDGDAATASAGHLAALKDQIGRVNEVVRRFLDVAEPSAPLGFTDVGGLLADTANLFGHDARRRRIELSIDAHPGPVRTRADPERVAPLILGLFCRAMAETPEGGKLAAKASVRAGDVLVGIEHAAGDLAAELGYYSDVVQAAAARMGGGFTAAREGGVARLELRLPRDEHE
jgi:signal transduction histidine kinase